MDRRRTPIGRRIPAAAAALLLVPLAGCDRPPAFPAAPVQVAEPESDSCLVSGRIVSKAWSDKGGGIERGIVRAWRIPEHELVEEAYGTGEEFQIRLPPGQYRLIFSANGSRGATFEVESRELTVADDLDRIPMDEVDLPISKTTGLYGRQAPELDGIIAWQGTSPLLVKALRGRVIVLDFFAYTCSICHAHKPDLIRLRDQYEGEGLVVLAIHDASLATLEEMNARMEPALRRAFGGAPPPFQMALDGSEQAGVFEAYGIYAVPAVILIDQGGRVVRRYHHAGDPELAADVHELLTRDLSKAF